MDHRMARGLLHDIRHVQLSRELVFGKPKSNPHAAAEVRHIVGDGTLSPVEGGVGSNMLFG